MRKRNPLPPVDELLRLYVYDPVTGIITWRADRFGYQGRRTAKAGTVAGSIVKGGYRGIWVDNIRYAAHRIAWKMHYRQVPPYDIDHIDRNPDNNAIKNLRAATRAQNRANSRILKRNTSGIPGVQWNKGKWRASITSNYKKKYLGLFTKLDDAVAARLKAAVELFGEFSPHQPGPPPSLPADFR